jgi:hypothetical protein
MTEGRELAESRIKQLEEMTDDDLLGYMANPESGDLTSPSGAVYALRIKAGRGSGESDDDPDLWVELRIHGQGLRWWQRYIGSLGRWESAEMRDCNYTALKSVWAELLGFGCVVAFLLALVGPWIVGVGFLISLLL